MSDKLAQLTNDPITQALKNFAPLSQAETNLLASIQVDEIAYCGPSHLSSDERNDPASSSTWGSERAVRAALLRAICVNHETNRIVGPNGIRLHAAKIGGELDLGYANLPFPLVFTNCVFDSDIEMRVLTILELKFFGCHLRNLRLNRATINSSLFLIDNTRVNGVLQLIDAHIGGSLDCRTSHFETPQDDQRHAIDATGVTIGSDVSLVDGFVAKAVVCFVNARVAGDFDARGGVFNSLDVPGDNQGVALDATTADIRIDVLLSDKFVAHGSVIFARGRIGSNFIASGGAFSGKANSDQSGYAIDCTDINVVHDVILDEEITCHGYVGFSGAHIGGDLQCTDGRFYNPIGTRMEEGGKALGLDNVTVDGDLRMNGMKSKFRAVGSVSVVNSRIGGDLDCSDAFFENPIEKGAKSSGDSLSFDRTVVTGSATLHPNFEASGRVSVINAHIGGDLSFTGARLRGIQETWQGFYSDALALDNVYVAGDLFLRNNFNAEGGVSLLEANIGGSMDCTAGCFSNPFNSKLQGSAIALNAARAVVKGTLTLRSAKVEGKVSLVNAHIGMDLDCGNGQFSRSIQDLLPTDDSALACQRIQVTNDVYLNGTFTANGKVLLDDAQIGGALWTAGGHFFNPRQANDRGDRVALTAFATKVGRTCDLGRGFQAIGEVLIQNAVVEQSLTITGAKFSAPDSAAALSLQGTNVKGAIYIRDTVQIDGILDLSMAFTPVFFDDPKTWPPRNKLRLNGFVYKSFGNEPRSSITRIDWLDRQPPAPLFSQPFLQLAKVLSDSGDEDGSRKVLIALEDRKTRTSSTGHVTGLIDRAVLGRTVGYGYRPLGAVWELAALTAIGWIIYRRSHLAGNIVPTDENAFPQSRDGQLVDNYERFSPFIYSLENSLPLVKLGQVDKWKPRENLNAPALARSSASSATWRLPRPVLRMLHNLSLGVPGVAKLGRYLTHPTFLRWFLRIQILLGWLLATLFVAGISGLIHSK